MEIVGPPALLRAETNSKLDLTALFFFFPPKTNFKFLRRFHNLLVIVFCLFVFVFFLERVLKSYFGLSFFQMFGGDFKVNGQLIIYVIQLAVNFSIFFINIF